MNNGTETARQIRARIENNLSEATPVEIDTVLSELWDAIDRADRAESVAQQIAINLRDKVSEIKNGAYKGYEYRTAKDGILLMERLVAAREEIAKCRAWAEKCKEMAKPFEAEYDRRGGWNRVFLAKSADGHAHNGTECSTCHHGESRTQFAWLVQYSGKTEEEIVADAGERACTTCYKSAPVSVLKQKTKMFTPDEIEAQKAREQREAERARKAQAAADKSITTPEGGRVNVSRSFTDYAKTLRTAEIGATDALYELIREQQHAVDPEWAWYYEDGRRSTDKEQAEIAYGAWHILRSIAFKKGLSFQEVFEIHEKKAQAKIKKIDREWAKDPRNPKRVK